MSLKLLDLFSCAGGAARGYQNAGFHVTGVDINPQPNYAGDAFVQGDALEYLAAHGHEYDALHGSPPCQASCTLIKGNQKATAGNHINLIPATRAAFTELTVPTIIENVQGSDLRRDLTLCGEMFGLGVIRHRYFEVTGFEVTQPPHSEAPRPGRRVPARRMVRRPVLRCIWRGWRGKELSRNGSRRWVSTGLMCARRSRRQFRPRTQSLWAVS